MGDEWQMETAGSKAPTTAPMPLDDDRSLLRRLRRAVEAGEVSLRLDMPHLAHIHSPVARETDDNLFLYPSVIATAALGWWVGWPAAVASAALALAVYFLAGRPWGQRRLAARVRQQALYDTALWISLWGFGGVSLVGSSVGREAEPPICRSPEQSWRKFAAALPAET